MEFIKFNRRDIPLYALPQREKSWPAEADQDPLEHVLKGLNQISELKTDFDYFFASFHFELDGFAGFSL